MLYADINITKHHPLLILIMSSVNYNISSCPVYIRKTTMHLAPQTIVSMHVS